MKMRSENDPYDAETIRTAIRAALTKADKSAPAVCKEADVADRGLSNFLRGGTETVRLDTLVRISHVLGVSVGELIGESKLAASDEALDSMMLDQIIEPLAQLLPRLLAARRKQADRGIEGQADGRPIKLGREAVNKLT
jgi:transcriptional regulator with XRE-family HTH domain